MTVYQQNGRWYYKFQIRGRRFHKAIPEATCKRDAEKAEAIIRAELLHGKFDLAEGKGEMLFSKLVDVYEEYTKANNASYQTCLYKAKLLRAFFSNRKLSEIIPDDIQRYRSLRQKEFKDKAKKKPISNTTINREVEILRKMFNLALDNNWYDKNPAASRFVKKLKTENFLERFLSPEEEERLFGQCTGEFEYMKDILICALNTGMRKGEILGLTWDCVDFKEGFITLLRTKSGKKRKIPISSAFRPVLESLYKEKLSEYVFTSPWTGGPYFDLKRAFPSICKTAGITNLRFHDLRHTAATRMVASGIDLIVVQDILGHADIHTTMRYAHPVPERKLLAVEALANFGKKLEEKQASNVIQFRQRQA